MKLLSGLDVLLKNNFDHLSGKKLGILCNQASVNQLLSHLIDILIPYHHNGQLQIQGIFGPQHGLWGYTQDNMIEWEGYHDQRTGLNIYSLYGKNRKPPKELLADIDIFLVDLQDIGARYYTFIWSMALTFEACMEEGISVMILDRINPISGNRVEGTILDPDFSSFVGLYPLATRHGMTIGEIAKYFQEEYYPELNLQIVHMQGWNRSDYFPDTGYSWVMPSPNIPTWESALVYPGMCLLEGTNLSEGRGTTHPFEIFGAPWIYGWKISHRLNQLKLPGVYFRPIQFLPMFQKYKNEICEGAFIHVIDKNIFNPVITAVALIREIMYLYPENFTWKPPPYEYEYKKMPFDILAGNSWLRESISNYIPLITLQERMEQDLVEFKKIRENYLFY